jgi:membrane associated rhomboid family serine protease
MKATKEILLLPMAMIIMEVANLVLGGGLNKWGIIPRNIDALPGILYAPFLHANIGHFLANIVPVMVLSFLLYQQGRKPYWLATSLIIVLSGLLVWCFARPLCHIGASGLIYGWVSYLIVSAVYSRHFRDLLLAVIVIGLYAGIWWGLLPLRKGISWESHLFGAIAGVVVASRIVRRG